MIETVVALLMIVNNEIKEHRIQENMAGCLRGKRQAERQAIRERDAKQEAAMWEELPEYKPQETTTPDLSPPKVTRNLYDIPEETDQELEDYHLGKEFGEIRI